MRLHCFQHVPFEGPATIGTWAAANNHVLGVTRWDLGQTPPQAADIDMLVVMGGPMSVNDTDLYPWLAQEGEYVRAVMNAGIPVLGICLGAQLIALSLGAQISRNEYTEIGWFAVTRAQELADTGLACVIPEKLEAFHWHGETFSLPAGSTPVGASAACANQGFLYGDRVIGLQFHLELSADAAAALMDNCREELLDGAYIQTPRQMLERPDRFTRANTIMAGVLDYMQGYRP